MDRAVRLARLFVVASLLGLSIAWLVWTIDGFNLSDASAYRAAAERLLAGADLYTRTATQDEAFRYAPWFAAAWVPLSALPHTLGNTIWVAALVIASVAAVVPLARTRGLAARLLAVLGGTMLLWTAARGNVHPFVIAALVHGLDRRSGPVWVALAASLKAVPILFVLLYVARGEWRRATWAIAITTALVLPMPLLGWEFDSIDAGESLSLYYLASPTVWAIVAATVAIAAVAIAWRRSRLAALGAATAAIVSLPRLLLYDLTYLVVGAQGSRIAAAHRVRLQSTVGESAERR